MSEKRVTLKNSNGQQVTIVLTKEDAFNRYGHPVAQVPLVGSDNYDEIVVNEERRYLRQDWKEVEAS